MGVIALVFCFGLICLCEQACLARNEEFDKSINNLEAEMKPIALKKRALKERFVNSPLESLERKERTAKNRKRGHFNKRNAMKMKGKPGMDMEQRMVKNFRKRGAKKHLESFKRDADSVDSARNFRKLRKRQPGYMNAGGPDVNGVDITTSEDPPSNVDALDPPTVSPDAAKGPPSNDPDVFDTTSSEDPPSKFDALDPPTVDSNVVKGPPSNGDPVPSTGAPAGPEPDGDSTTGAPDGPDADPEDVQPVP